MWGDPLLIVFISVCTAFLGEGLTWILVYRTEKYQKLKVEVERQSKKLEKRKEAHGDSLDKQHKKKIEREEERLKNNNRDLSLVKMKSMFAIGFAFTALLSMFNNIFDGRVVAKLPFHPISWIQGLSHRNLPGDDYTDCSFIFPIHFMHNEHKAKYSKATRICTIPCSISTRWSPFCNPSSSI
ncbi:unnamed protein product [Danaus chrysippus]|uniref:(African queen) hypothetical protein n=1 Tax=Danaus chrysippus TaxID=151541 RepID=A0A8J2QX90_9NEOP|nr:unnamed protein product [Danaus chrysippus]